MSTLQITLLSLDLILLLPLALEFDPDRFIDQRLHRYLTPNPYIFIPFNAGPRICLGQQVKIRSNSLSGMALVTLVNLNLQFAYHEASYYLVRLLQNFTGFTLDESANTPPPEDWAFGEGRKPREKIHLLVHLTMYIKVS